MKSTQYLDKLMSEKKLKNDAALAKFLELGKSNISQYRSGTRIMDNETCLKVALALEIDPIQIIMAADLDRAERTGQRSLWEVFSMKGATEKLASSMMAGFVAVNLFLTPDPATLPFSEGKTVIAKSIELTGYKLCEIEASPSHRRIFQ